MGKRHRADTAIELDEDTAASVAQSLRDDFVGLIAIFDRQLANRDFAACNKRSKISDAKAAAERGLTLSEELIELLAIR